MKYSRFNFWVNVLDNTFYWFGDAFTSVITILPLFVARLTDSTLLVGLLPAIWGAGLFAPQLLGASYAQHLPRQKGFVIWLNVVKRLAVFLAAFTIFAFGDRQPTLLLLAVLACYAVSNVATGFSIPAWSDLIAKVIPVGIRGRWSGLSNFLGGGLGAIAGLIARYVLAAVPFPINFGLCFLFTGLAMTISLLFFSLTREPSSAKSRPRASIFRYFGQLPRILRRDRNFSFFIVSLILVRFSYMALPFLALAAVERFHLPDAEVGTLTFVLFASQTGLTLLWGTVADRWGHKLVLQFGAASMAAAIAMARIADSPLWFYAVFLFAGSGLAASLISDINILLEFPAPEDRPAYVGLRAALAAPVMIGAPLLGGWLAGMLGYQQLFLLALFPVLAGLIVLAWAVQEPRWHAPSHHGA